VKRLRALIEDKGILLFPICQDDHWYTGIVDFAHQRLCYAEGLGRNAPKNFRQNVLGFLRRISGADTLSNFEPVRPMECPKQLDANSCGIIALSFIQGFCVGDAKDEDKWDQKSSCYFRVTWLERVLKHHAPSLEFHYENAPTERDRV